MTCCLSVLIGFMFLGGSLTLGILVGKPLLGGKVLSVVLMVLLVVGFVLLLVGGRLVGFCCVLFLPVFELVDCSS